MELSRVSPDLSDRKGSMLFKGPEGLSDVLSDVSLGVEKDARS